MRSSRPTFSIPGTTQKEGGTEAVPIPAQTLVLRDSTALANVRRRLRQRSEVRYVQSNIAFSLNSSPGRIAASARSDSVLSSENAFLDSLDHLSVIRAPDGWDVTTGDRSVSVGVVDAGIYLRHPDLANQFQGNPAEDLNDNDVLDASDRNGVDDGGNGYVDDVVGYDFVDRPGVAKEGEYRNRDPDPSPDSTGAFSFHGTAVAGVISARAADPQAGMVGVAPRTRLVALRAFGGDGFGRTDDIAAAIVYGASRGVDVLNLSFGRSRAAPLLEEAIEFAVDQGTVVVASAGNGGAVDVPHYPSDYPEVISVVWLAEDGDDVPNPSFSQHGIGADLGAPGSNVFTTLYPRRRVLNDQPIRQKDLYGSLSGSSFSAPQVAGAAALLRSVDSTLSPTSIQSILAGTAADIDGVSWDHTTGAGRLDVARGLLRSYPARTTLLSPEHNQGVRGNEPVSVVGTALDPSFQDYALYYAQGTRNLDARPDPWVPIAGPIGTRAYRDTLARWNVSTLPEGAYTLRLVTTLDDGRTVEDRRRVVIDRTRPEARVKFLGAGRVDGRWGVLADVASDDTVQSRMRIRLRGGTHVVEGEFETSRQGLFWTDESGLGGTASVRITLTNRSGLHTQVERTVSVPPDQSNSALLRRAETDVPNGVLLPHSTDFDGDQLSEIVLTQTRNGGLSDTLRVFEWSPSGFVSSDTLLARLFPKDVGDTNLDGRKELLLQVGGATVLLEQRTADGGLPNQIAYADTTGVSGAREGPSIHGALLTDLDRDRQGEIVGNWKKDDTSRTKWRVLERRDSGFERVDQLEYPTDRTRSGQPQRGSPNAASGDFDGDGQRDLLVGDRDGNWVIYESTGNDEFEVAWTYETRRFGTDTRFAVGNILGDRRPEFVTFSTFDPRSQEGGEFEPAISFYHVWRAVGDDTYERVYRLPVAGPRPSAGGLTAADFTGDGLEEVAIVHPPSLIVLGRSEQGEMNVLHHRRMRPSVRGPSIVAEDFTGSGTPSLVTSSSGDSLQRYVVNRPGLRRPPPRWVRARPAGASSSRLSWRAPEADSVTVYSGTPGATLGREAVTSDSSIVVEGSARKRFALRAWRDGQLSTFSSDRQVRPHAPATVTQISYPEPATVRLRFTEPLARSVRPDQFQLRSHGAPRSVLRANGGTGLLLRFPDTLAGTSSTLTWTGVTDTSGLAVGHTQASVSLPAPSTSSLFVKDSKITGEQRVRLTFSAPLDGDAARDPTHYNVRPRGFVEDVQANGSTPTTVTVLLDDVVAGATGEEAVLAVTSMRSAQGASLADEGATVRLTQPADDLSNVFVYPNPVKLAKHDHRLTIAGLPRTATVRIYHPSGRLVDVLSVKNGRTGGTTWDLTNQQGERVPSGIYLVRVEAPGASSVLKKAAVIR
ncbi:MAG: S8 family serine peptidase [Salinibacter sp.]|uniref:S8 family serine peptidase n=1 Tax=Salinibacter sp. TaxID=2065818 RepID=UPI0035D45034